MRNRRTRGAFLPAMMALMVLVGVSMAGASQSGIAHLVSRARESVFGDSDRHHDAGGHDISAAGGDDWATASGDTNPKDHRGPGIANALEHRGQGQGRRGDHVSSRGGRGKGRNGEHPGERGRSGDPHGNASGDRGRSDESHGRDGSPDRGRLGRPSVRGTGVGRSDGRGKNG